MSSTTHRCPLGYQTVLADEFQFSTSLPGKVTLEDRDAFPSSPTHHAQSPLFAPSTSHIAQVTQRFRSRNRHRSSEANPCSPPVDIHCFQRTHSVPSDRRDVGTSRGVGFGNPGIEDRYSHTFLHIFHFHSIWSTTSVAILDWNCSAILLATGCYLKYTVVPKL